MITCNGKLVLDHDKKSQLFDPKISGKLRGVFETMRTYDGVIFRLEEHLARLQRSAKLAHIVLPLQLRKIQAFLDHAVRACGFEPARIKLIVTKGDVLIQCLPLKIDPQIYNGVSVVSVRLQRNTPEAKSLNYAKNFAVHEKAKEKGCFEALLIDRKGIVREGAYSNLFWVKKGRLFTTKSGILKGITRQTVLEATKVSLSEIRLDQLEKADEVFLTQTSREIIPVTRVNGAVIGNGTVGPVTSEAKQAFAKWRDAYVARKS